MSFLIIRGIVNQTRSLSFAEAKGTVLSSSLKVTNNEGPSYAPKIAYRYDVDGETFRNDVISHEVQIFTEKYAGDLVAANPTGTPMSVYYNESNPQDSTATRGITGGGLLMVVFMIPFNIVFLFCAVAAWCVFSGKDDEAYLDRITSCPLASGFKWLFWPCIPAAAAVLIIPDYPPSLTLVAIVFAILALIFTAGCAKSFLSSDSDA
jgi:hypothetical protein